MKRGSPQIIRGTRTPRRAIEIILLAALALPPALALTGSGANPPPLVRVKIGDLASSLEISGPGLALESAGKLRRGDDFSVVWDGGSARVDGKKAALPISVSGGTFISVDGVQYRGRVRIIASSVPLVVNLVDVESYAAGVINQEIDSRWPQAALDAQVILARTYALARREERRGELFDLDRTVNDQVYGGAAAEDDLAWAAVNRTRGLVLTYGNELAAGLYHSCCGGRTAFPSEVWGGQDRPYQKSVECIYCEDAPRYFWRFPEKGSLDSAELSAMLGLKGAVTGLTVLSRTRSGRAASVLAEARTGNAEFTGQEFRKRMGYDKIWSTAFQVEKDGTGFVFRGSGSGHGAGLCQWGACGMAQAGFSSARILGYYFPGAVVRSYDRLGLK
ncbi:MAG TPA: SpoIID/LytB domain-containing protein [bacterium]|nr:SpoIID/LytB domain-containing protein [bacterium]